MDWSFLSDPNMQQWMGNAGQKLQAGEGWAAALNPSDVITNVQMQKAVGGYPTKQSEGKKPSAFDFLMGMEPTPKGSAGPDSINLTKTADGTKMSFSMPSDANLNTYGTSVPPEAYKAPISGGGVSEQPPFWEMLLGLK